MSEDIKYYGPGLPVSVGIKEINKLIDAVAEARKDLAAAKLRRRREAHANQLTINRNY